MALITVKGQNVVVQAPPKRYPAGRVCAEDECSTQLSIYNRAAFCWQHDGGRVARMGRRALVERRFVNRVLSRT